MQQVILDLTLRQILKKIGLIKPQQSTVHSPPKKAEYIPPTQRRFEGGQLKGFHTEFFHRRDTEVRELLKEVMNNGAIKDEMFLKPELGVLDERVVEYPVALLSVINKVALKKDALVLDVGGVMNNAVISGYISNLVDMFYLMNPSLEPFQYKENLTYILSDMRQHYVPECLKFDLITCLSTVEHIGLNNERYGGGRQEFEGLIDDPHKFAIEGAKSIARMVAPGGKLLISVPFGHFEYLYIYGKPEDPIYYVFNEKMLFELQES